MYQICPTLTTGTLKKKKINNLKKNIDNYFENFKKNVLLIIKLYFVLLMQCTLSHSLYIIFN